MRYFLLQLAIQLASFSLPLLVGNVGSNVRIRRMVRMEGWEMVEEKENGEGKGEEEGR